MTLVRRMGTFAILFVLAAPPTRTRDAGQNPSGVHPEEPSGPCIPPTGPRETGSQGTQLAFFQPVLSFYPIGGRQNRDIWISNYADLDDDPIQVEDFSCGNRTYDNHWGSDSTLRSFGEQTIGVPVYAALDGMVTGIQDGEPDMNTKIVKGTPSNYVIIDHGNGFEGRYWHLRMNSVSVAVNQQVVAGQQIGETASSGNSNWPHLHFQLEKDGNLYEPFGGACNPDPGLWVKQPAKLYDTVVYDFAFSEDSPEGISPPHEWPRSSHFPQTADQLYLWVYLRHVPAGSHYKYVFRRPDSSISYTYAASFNKNSFSKGLRSWVGVDFGELHTIPGTWSVDYYVNDVLHFNAPIEVKPTLVPGFNRPPEKVSVSFWPGCPQATDVIQALVDTDLVQDDPDYDLVRYRYHWKVNDITVRDVITAGHKDVLPRGTASGGDAVTCVVTPKDQAVDGPSSTAVATIGVFTISNYCTAGTTSSGCQATMSASGSPSKSLTSGFLVAANGVEAKKLGLLFWGYAPNAQPWGAGSSFICVGGAVERMGVQSSDGGVVSACDGTLAVDFNTWMATNPSRAPVAGDHVYVQAWFRDPGAPNSSSLSDGIQFPICP
jgi:hypothetical protein